MARFRGTRYACLSTLRKLDVRQTVRCCINSAESIAFQTTEVLPIRMIWCTVGVYRNTTDLKKCMHPGFGLRKFTFCNFGILFL